MDKIVTREAYDALYALYLQMAAERNEAQQRIAALEAQIAAAGWRPVTEPPETSDRYLVHLIGLDFNGEWIRERDQVATSFRKQRNLLGQGHRNAREQDDHHSRCRPYFQSSGHDGAHSERLSNMRPLLGQIPNDREGERHVHVQGSTADGQGQGINAAHEKCG